jgi:hypothetical protein
MNREREYYPVSRWWKAGSDFRRIFHVSIAPFFDSSTTCLFQKIRINPFTFDDYLHELYGNYEDRGLSMQELILEKYGEEGEKLINALI